MIFDRQSRMFAFACVMALLFASVSGRRLSNEEGLLGAEPSDFGQEAAMMGEGEESNFISGESNLFGEEASGNGSWPCISADCTGESQDSSEEEPCHDCHDEEHKPHPPCHDTHCGPVIQHEPPAHVIIVEKPEVVVTETTEVDIVIILQDCIVSGDYQPFIKAAVVLIVAGEGEKVANICAEYYAIHKIIAIIEAFSQACEEAAKENAILATKTVTYALELKQHEAFVKECVVIIPYSVFYESCWNVYEASGNNDAAWAWADLAALPIKYGHTDLVAQSLSKTFTASEAFASSSASAFGSILQKEPQYLCEALSMAEANASSGYGSAFSKAQASAGVSC